MLLFKTKRKHMRGVLKEAKHAFKGKPKGVKKGEVILITQTKNTLQFNQKPIRYVMEFVSCEEDIAKETDRIWGRHWKYILTGKNVRRVKPFDIEEIKVSSKNYNGVRTHCKVNPEDEKAVLNWIRQ